MEPIEKIDDLPLLDESSIHIWGVHMPKAHHRLEALRQVLSTGEKERAQRIRRVAAYQSFISARGTLRVLLSGYTGTSPEKIIFRYMAAGKPYIADSCINFNLSHSGEWVVLSIGRYRNIGVDIERIDRKKDVLSISTRYFSPQETAFIRRSKDWHAVFFRLWARKEAYMKARCFSFLRESIAIPVPLEKYGKKGNWIFRELEAGSRYAAALVTDREVTNISCFDFGVWQWEA